MSQSDTPSKEDILAARERALNGSVSQEGESYGADSEGVLQERFLDNPAVCRNCFREVRVARECRESRTGRGDVSVTKSAYTIHDRNVSVEYVPAKTVRRSSRVFCRCGSDSAFIRLWDSGDLDTDRFLDLTENLLRTALSLGVLDCPDHPDPRGCLPVRSRVDARTCAHTRARPPARPHMRTHMRTHAPGCAPAQARARARRGWSKFSSDDFANEQRRGGIADHILEQALDEAIAVQAARNPSNEQE